MQGQEKLSLAVPKAKNHDILFNQKSPEKFVKKSEKSVDKVVSRWYIVKLSGARATRKAAENRITTAFEGFLKLLSFEKTSKKSQKSS